MGKLSYNVRQATTGVKNSVRWGLLKFPSLKRQRIHKLSQRGLSPFVRAALKSRRDAFVHWRLHGGIAPSVRVKTSAILTNRANANPTFVGIGLDEHVATRMQRTPANWGGVGALTAQQAKDISGARSRTADLAWPTGDAANPIAGHTPGVKSAAVSGTKSAITTGHHGRDNDREAAVTASLNDYTSPDRFFDSAVMGNLATAKYMTAPQVELNTARNSVLGLASPRFSALTGNNDLRQPGTFDSFTNHVQEARERLKWETASVMMKDDRLQHLVPPTMKSYLSSMGNDPKQSMNTFRHDIHESYLFGPNVNRAPTSDTEDLTATSLHQMAAAGQGQRRRALSDARMLPRYIPPNARGN